MELSESLSPVVSCEVGSVVCAFGQTAISGGNVLSEYGSVLNVGESMSIIPNGRVFVEEIGSVYQDCVLRENVSFGVVIDCVLGSLGDLRLPASAIEGFEYHDVLSAGFVPDVYAVRYLSQESGLSRPRTVDALVALRNLLEMCKGLGVGTVHAFCMKFRLVMDRRGHKFWVIEFT